MGEGSTFIQFTGLMLKSIYMQYHSIVDIKTSSLRCNRISGALLNNDRDYLVVFFFYSKYMYFRGIN